MAGVILRSFHQCRKTKHTRRCIRGFLRTLLTDAYRCDQTWVDRLKSPLLKEVDFPKTYVVGTQKNHLNETSFEHPKHMLKLMDVFSNKVSRGLDTTKQLSVIDMDIFVNKLQDMTDDDEPLVQSILTKFQRTQSAYPVNDAINHAIIRSYIQLGKTDKLISMIRDKHKYGIFFDPHAASILMDHFLRKEDYAGAAKVAYELMLQGDFSHPTSFILSLFSCVKLLQQADTLERWEPAEIDPEAEVEYIPVKYIRVPYYDDHFDIPNDRLLLGKTLCSLGKELDNMLGRSLQLVGLGLYEKFPKANTLLEDWMASSEDGPLVLEEAVTKYSEYLSEAPTRDPNAEEKSQGERTMDDEMVKLRLTPEEKEDCLTKYQVLVEQLRKGNRISEDKIETLVENHVNSELPKYEQDDIETLKSTYEEWEKKRAELLEIQTKEYLIQQKEKKILSKFLELHQKEQLLTFFEKENELDIAVMKESKVRASTRKKAKTEGFVEAPGEREVKKMKKKK